MMNGTLEHINIISLIPLIITGGAALLLMLLIAVKRLHFVSMMVSLLAFIAAFISLTMITPDTPSESTGLLIIDRYAIFFTGLILISGFVVTVLSYDYMKQHRQNPEEYYILVFLATLGAGVLVASQHFVSLFLGFELLSVSLYIMIAYLRHRDLSIEAGTKYLILAAVSSAFLLFGMALVYTASGTMHLAGLAEHLSNINSMPMLMRAGFAMMFGGISFKLALVPFHMWTPDVYQGAPSPVTGFVATISKGAVFAILFRLYSTLSLYHFDYMMVFFIIIAIASMFTGNILALLQQNVKRVLAYSSIAHLGYLLIAFIAGEELGGEAAGFYLIAYFITILGAFGVISVMSHQDREPEHIDEYRGLFWKHPWLAFIFSAMLFSLAGIPLTAGFLGKFYVAAAGLSANQIALVVILVINSVIGIYYYLRIIVAMFSSAGQYPSFTKNPGSIPDKSLTILSALLILLIWFGVYPRYIIELIHNFVQL